MKIEIDFSDAEDIYAKLKEIARKERRSIANQVLYWLENNIDDYIGLNNNWKKRGGSDER